MNTTHVTNIRLNLIDNVTRKLKALYAAISKQEGAVSLAALTAGATNLGTALQGAFSTTSSQKWYNTVFGFLKGATKYATIFGDALVGGFLAAGAAAQTLVTVISAIATKWIVSINSEMEQFEVMLQTTLHSLTAAKEQMADIVQFAKETPYQIKEITAAVTKLAAYNMPVDKWLKPLGDMASAFGRDITDAVEAAADAMTGMFRRALSYGIKMERSDFDQGGKYAGMTYADAFMMEVQKRFSGGMELQAKTFKGIVSNIKDTFYIAFQQATQPAFEGIKGIVSDVYDWLNANSGQIQRYFKIINDTVMELLDTAKEVFKYFQKDILPSLVQLFEVTMEVWSTFKKVMGTLITAFVVPALTVLGKLLELFVDLIDYAKMLLVIYMGYRAAVLVLKLLGVQMVSLAAKTASANGAATLLSTTLKTVTTRVLLLAAALGIMWIAEKFIKTRDAIKELGGSFDKIAGGAEKVKGYLEELGKANNFSTDEMAEAANVAKEYGNNMQNALEIGAKAAGASNLNMQLSDTIELIGQVSDAFIHEGDSAELMAKKTTEAAELLKYLKDNAEELGITFEDVQANFERYPDVLEAYGDNIEGLGIAIKKFTAAAWLEESTADLNVLFKMLQNLMAPTKEMLLNYPTDTWISRSTADLKTLSKQLETSDAELSARYLASAETIEEIMNTYGIIAGQADKAQAAAKSTVGMTEEYAARLEEEIEKRRLTGADAVASAADKELQAAEARERSAKAIEAANKTGVLTPLATNQPAGAVSKVSVVDWVVNHPVAGVLGVIAATIAIAKVLNKGFSKLGQIGIRAIKVQTAAAGTRLARFGLNYATRNASATALGMAPEEAAAGRTWLARRLLKMEDKLIYRTLPSNLLDRIETATQEQVKILNAARNKRVDQLTKELDAALQKSGRKAGQKARTLSSQIRVTNAQFDDAIRDIRRSYGDLAKEVANKRVPTSMRQLALQIVDFTNNLELAAKSTARTARTTATAARSLSKSGKGIMGALFSVPLFGPGLKKISRSIFGAGRVAPRVAGGGAGVSSVAASVNAVQTGNVVKRLESQWLRKQFSRLTGTILGPFKKSVSSGLAAEAVYKPIVEAIDSQTASTVNAFERFGKTIPDEIGKRLTELGGTTTKEFETIFQELFAGRNIRTVSLAGITEPEAITHINKVTKAFMDAIIEMPKTGRYALTGEEGLSAWLHEFMHTAQEGKGRTAQGIVAKTANEAQFLKELDAWQKAADALKAMGVDVKNNTAFIKTATESLETYAKKAGLSTDILDRAIKTVADRLPVAVENISKAATETATKATTVTRATAPGRITIDSYAGKALAQTEKAAVKASNKSALILGKQLGKLVGKGIGGVTTATMVTDLLGTLVAQETVMRKSTGQEISMKPLEYQKQMSEALLGPGEALNDTLKGLAGAIGTVFTAGQVGGTKELAGAIKDVPEDLGKAAQALIDSVQSNKMMMDYLYSHGMDVEMYNKATAEIIAGTGKSKEVDMLYDKLVDYSKAEPSLMAAAKANELAAKTNKLAAEGKVPGIKFDAETMASGAGNPFMQMAIQGIPEAAEKAMEEVVPVFEQGAKTAGQAIANGVKEGMDSVDISSEGVDQMLEGLVTKGSYGLADIQAGLKKMDDRLQHLEKTEIPLTTKKVQELEEMLSSLDRQIKRNELDLAKFGQEMTNIASTFDLAIAINELALVSDSAQAARKEIARLNVVLAQQEIELASLETRLQAIQTEFDEVSNTINKAQESLDKFLNAPVEGEGAYLDRIYEIDKQLSELELKKINLQPTYDLFSKAGMLDSDAFKKWAAETGWAMIENQMAALENEKTLEEAKRRNATMDIEHFKEKSQREEEFTTKQIEDGVNAAMAVIEANKPRLEQLEKELEKQQSLVEKKQQEIEATNNAIAAHERELTLLERKVELANQDAQAAKEKMEANKKIFDLEGAITDMKMMQTAEAMAQGLISTEVMESLVTQYNALADKTSDITRTQTGLNYRVQAITFDKEYWDKRLATAQAEQGTLIDNINRLVQAAEDMITGVNADSEGFETALANVFGADIKGVVGQMSLNLAAMARGKEGATTAFPSYQFGGIELAQEQLALLHGPEAIIPLHGGAVPVKIYGAATQGESGPVTINQTTVEVGSIVVRDDNDLEEIKQAILDLRQGNTTFFSRASQYSERF